MGSAMIARKLWRNSSPEDSRFFLSGLNRIVLDVFQGHQASLFVKAVELIGTLLCHTAGKPPRKIDGVMDAAIHPHSTLPMSAFGGKADIMLWRRNVGL
jgi:hypothetical protein